MKILHIDCSARNEQSVSRVLSELFVNILETRYEDLMIDYLDLASNTPNHVAEFFIESNYTPPDSRSPEMVQALAESDELIDRLYAAEVYVIGMPMYNFCIPSNFKAFIDNVVRIWRTFTPTETGSEGLLKNKKVYVINTRGADFARPGASAMDHLVPYLTTIFGFMGLNDVHFINVSPVKWGTPERLREVMANAENEVVEAALSV